MLDLERLEKKLDDALANETPESLRNWLRENRKKSLYEYLGEGSLEDMGLTSSRFDVKLDTKSISNENGTTPNYHFKFAA